MADFSLDDVNTVATQFGMSPDYVSQQLRAEGHNILEPTPVAAPPAPTAPGVFGAYTGEVAPAPVPTGTPDAFGSMLQRESNQAVAGMNAAPAPAHLRSRVAPVVREESQPVRGQRGGVRASGLGRQAPQQAGGGEAGGGFGRARKLLDAHERQLASEYEDAGKQYQEGAARLSLLDDERMSFAQQKADIEAGYAQQRAAVAEQAGQAQARAAQDEAVARQKEDQALAAREKRLEQGRRELVDMKVKGPGLGGRLSNALAVALSQYGDAISATGGVDTNYAQATQQIVNDTMDRALNEQLRVIDSKGGALNAEEQGIVRLRQQFGDDAAFREYMRSTNREAMIAKLDTLAAQSDNETTKLAAQALATDWKATAETEAQKGRGAALEEARKRLRGAADDRFGFELAASMPKGDGKKAVPGVNGLRAIGEVTPDDRKKAQEIATKNNALLSTVRRLGEMSREGGTWDQSKVSRSKRLLATLVSQSSQAFGSGTPQEGEAQRMMDSLANPTDVATLKDAQRVFDNFEQDIQLLTDDQLAPYNFATDQGAGDGFEVE